MICHGCVRSRGDGSEQATPRSESPPQSPLCSRGRRSLKTLSLKTALVSENATVTSSHTDQAARIYAVRLHGIRLSAFYRNTFEGRRRAIHRERFTGRSRPGPLSLHSLYHSDQAPSNYELPRLTPTSYYFRLSDSRLSTPQAEQTQRALVVCISTTLLGEASESAWCTRVGLRGKQPLK